MKNSRNFLAGGGEMGERMRALDWSKTVLGPVESWPQSLRSAVSICLGSRFPIVLYWGADYVVLYNDAYAEILGRKHPWALGRRCKEVWSEIWNVIAPMLEGVTVTGEATWSDEQLLILERKGYPEECYFSFSFSPVRGATGGVEGIFTAVIENTRRVLGERRLRTLRNLAARAAAAKSESEAWRSAGEGLADNPHDLPFAVLYRTDGGGNSIRVAAAGTEPGMESTAWPIERAIASGKMEHAVEHAGGALVLPVSRPGVPAYGCLVAGLGPRRPLDDEYRGFLSLVADQIATAIANARADEEEKQRAEALAEIDRAKTAFFSNVSHEFRTPLTLMLGPLEDGLNDAEAPLAPAQRERLELVRRNGLRLHKLVNTLLDFSRIEAGRAQASYAPVDLAALTADLASTFRSAVEKAGLGLVVDCPPLSGPAYVDREMWEKIVLNLLSNAFKFTFEGEISVSLQHRGDAFELAVRDTGTGIPAAELPHVFERFRRVAGAKSRSHEGTGIGLALVQELAKLHGGAIAAQSAEGEGSTFSVSIPAGKDHLPSERIGAGSAPSPTGVNAEAFVEETLHWLPGGGTLSSKEDLSTHGPRARIVWADDNADMREYVRKLLATRYEVEAVPDGEAALAAVRARLPDLVLADVMMPKLDGLGLLRALRADPQTHTIPAIVLSARAGEEGRIEGLDAGADDYIVKPFGARELLARVDSQLKMSRLRREASSKIAESEQGLQAELADAKLLQGIAIELVHEDNVNLLYDKIMDAAVAVMRSDFASLQMLYPERGSGGELRLLAFRGFNPQAAKFWEWVRADSECTCGAALRAGQRVIAADVEKCDFMAGTEDLATYLKTGIRAVQSTPLLSRTGKLVGMISTHWREPHRPTERDLRVLDILARQAADLIERSAGEQALRDSREQLLEADQRKDEFMAMLAHELRNPLSAIALGADLLKRARLDDPKAQFAVPAIERQAKQLQRLADDMLDMARATYGKLTLKTERIHLLEMAKAVAALHARTGKSPKLEVAGEPAWVDGDAVRVQQMIGNLIENAVKYGGTKIKVRVRREEAWSRLSVQDDGQGIAPELLPDLFKPFVQGEQSLDRAQGGLGLGLALVDRLAALHGGSVEAQSPGVGQGSTFTLSLPAAAPAAAKDKAGPISAALKRRVLVVEDEKDVREMLRVLLESEGHEVSIADSGTDGLAKFGSFRPDVALVDIGLPGMDGYELARQARSLPGGSRFKLVAITGYGQEKDRRLALEAGFDLHVTKPVVYDQLARALET